MASYKSKYTGEQVDEAIDRVNSNNYAGSSSPGGPATSAINADTVDELHAGNFIGGGFIYPPYNGTDGSIILNDLKTDFHAFVMNGSQTQGAPTFHGFLDVKFFNGVAFAPSTPDQGGVILQTWHDWSDPTAVFFRLFRSGTWTEWKQVAFK